MQAPILILCAHGTRDTDGQALIEAVATQVRAAIDAEVVVAYVDVQEPTVADVVASIPMNQSGMSAVVVPYLLAGGYHVHVDIAEAVASRDDCIAAPALGPDHRLIDILLDRVREAGVLATATLVLAPAGSSDPRSQSDTELTLDWLRLRWDGPVRVGYAAGIEPTVAQAIRAARDYGEDSDDGDVAVVSYLLSPGFFQNALERSDADHVTAPLAPDARLVEIVVERYRAAQVF